MNPDSDPIASPPESLPPEPLPPESLLAEPLLADTPNVPPPIVRAEPVWQPLDPRHLEMETRTSWIFTIGFSIVGLIVSVLVGFWWGWTSVVFASIVGGCSLIAGLLLWSIWVVLPRSHQASGWMLSDRGIEIRKGVWWRHLIVIPKQRIQHSDLRQGPLLRAYGLANLVIFTAGTENAQVELVGLSFETAQTVRDRLLEISNVSTGGV